MIGVNSLVVEMDPGRSVQLQRQDPVLRKVAAALLDGRSVENGEENKELETFQSHFDRLSLNEAGIFSWNIVDSDVVPPLLSDQFVEGVQPALGAQLRLARATGQLSVKELVHLARELAEEPPATLQSQEKKDGSPVDELQTRVDQLAEQLAAMKMESRRHARTSRCYNALTQATIQTLIEIDEKRELCLIDTGAGVSLRQRGNQAERRPCALAVRTVGGYRLKIDGLSMHSIRLGDKSLQHTFLISPDIEETILGADFLRSTDSVVDLKQGKLVTRFGAVKLEDYPSTTISKLHVRKLPSCNLLSVQSVVREYSELFTGDEDPFGFCPWIEHEIALSSECFRPNGPVAAALLDGRSIENGEGDKESETLQSHFDRLRLNGPGIISWNTTDSDVMLPVIPRVLRRKLVVECHEMAHIGYTKTHDSRTRENFTAVQERTRQKTASRKVRSFPIGAKVKWKDHQNPERSVLRSRKLGSRWQGPFVVTDCRGNVYTIQDGRGSKRVNGTQLRKWSTNFPLQS
ncbi:gap-Pol polyprotein [Clonorchis sinensis]|uniref:Gap-Pol polyprotein n=1 Tax=Clonorchis sinensis TaxID=79923 RepID=G7YPS9_CLOSI|nr:gap-Pol polyprotein [Clonorchis sinensis]